MLNGFLDELRRRRVPQVAGVYLAGGWLAFEVAEATFPRLGLPDWTVTFVLVLLLLAFPLVIGLAWVYDVTPGGVRRTEPAESGLRTKGEAAPDQAASGAVSPGDSADASAIDEDGGVAAAPTAFGKIVGAGAIAGLALAGAFVLFGRGEPAVELTPNGMVVLPFTVRGGEDVAVLAEGMVELLSAKLDGVAELRSADPHVVLTLASDRPDPAGARELARRLGAGYYVLGSVLEFGGDLRLQASIHATEGSEPIAEASVEGADTAFLALVDDLAAELLLAGELAPPGRMPRIAGMTTESLPALKLFLEGERAIRETRYDDAIGLLQRAVETDTAFALAYYRMSVAASWAERAVLRSRALEAAQRHQDRLSERDRALVEAYVASKRGRHAEAERYYREILASYPDDLEAWYELGEVLFHRGAFLGYSIADARPPFDRALELDPGHGQALHHLTNIGSFTRDVALLDSATRVIRARQGGDAGIDLEAQWAFAMGDSAALEQAVSRLRGQDTVGVPFLFAAWAAQEPERVRRLMGIADSLFTPSSAAAALANALADFGQRDDALAWLEDVEADGIGAPVRTTILALDPALRTPPERLEGLRATLAAWDPGPIRTAPPGPDELWDHDTFLPHLRVYLLALIDARLGRTDEALRQADALEAMDGAPAVRVLASDLARHVRARVALDRGDAAEALRVIEGSSFWEATPWDERLSTVLNRSLPIMLRADALQALGRHREAIRWYSVLLVGRNEGYAHYRRAQAHEALGEVDRAAEAYAALVRMWAGADPDLQDRVTDARRQLEALAAEG